jgi:phosphoserine aminotransferase
MASVTFTSGQRQLDQSFAGFAERRGVTNLLGHRTVGGLRASLYNRIPLAGVELLVEILREFEQEHGLADSNATMTH